MVSLDVSEDETVVRFLNQNRISTSSSPKLRKKLIFLDERNPLESSVARPFIQSLTQIKAEVKKNETSYRGFAQIEVKQIRSLEQQVVADGVPFDSHANIKFDPQLLEKNEAISTNFQILLRTMQLKSTILVDNLPNSLEPKFESYKVQGIKARELVKI